MKERLSNTAYRFMALTFFFRDRFSNRVDILHEFDIVEGMHVVDYGCGPGSYLPLASKLVGPEGLVTAVDIHPLATQGVNQMACRKKLRNVMGMLARGNQTDIDDHCVHLVYAMDMFHMVKETTAMLCEIRRIIEPEGVLFIEPGHQSIKKARDAILASGHFTIEASNTRYFKCRPTP